MPTGHHEESACKLDAIVRDVFVHQRLVKEALVDAGKAITPPFVASARIRQPMYDLGVRIRQSIEFDLHEFRRQRTVEAAFHFLREKDEATGAFVFVIGNLESHHSNVSADVFLGFALADTVAPFIVVNGQDAKAAWSFTVLHELAHIWLGQTGISGGAFDNPVERYCNDIASELLCRRLNWHAGPRLYRRVAISETISKRSRVCAS